MKKLLFIFLMGTFVCACGTKTAESTDTVKVDSVEVVDTVVVDSVITDSVVVDSVK